MTIRGPGGLTRFIELAPVDTAIVAGVAAWIDTDLSATLGAGRKVCVFVCTSAGVPTNGFGVRPNGSAIDTLVPLVPSVCTLLSECSATGHIDFYRDPGSNLNYRLVGYLR